MVVDGNRVTARPSFGKTGTDVEFGLSSLAIDHAVAELGLRIDLAGQIDLEGIVNGNHIIILGRCQNIGHIVRII